jgi:hypothetical protein
VHGLAALRGAVCMDSLNRCSGILYLFVVVVKDSRNYRYPDFFFPVDSFPLHTSCFSPATKKCLVMF